MPADQPLQDPQNDLGPQEFAANIKVSRETIEHLKIYADMLREWNGIQNLVSKRSLTYLWQRHFLDSAQLAHYFPTTARSLVDLGTGAGFPGLVLSEILRNRDYFRTVVYESTEKKCRFLEAVTRRLDLNVEIRNSRVEDARDEVFDIVTARALAPLPDLLAYAQRFFGHNTNGLFLKGQNIASELTEAHKSWKMTTRQHPSISDPSGIILEVRELKSAREN